MFTCISGVRVVQFFKLHVFKLLVPCCDVRCDCRVKTMFGSPSLPYDLAGVHVLSMLYVSIYIYWFLTRFQCQMMFASFKTNTTGVTRGSGTVNPSGAAEFSGIRSLVFCVVFCRELFVLLAIVLSVLLRFAASEPH